MHSLVAALLVLLHSEPSNDSVLARRLKDAGLYQRAMLNADSALALLLASRRADPTFVPGQHEYMRLRGERFEHSILRDEAAALARSTDPNERCFGIVFRRFIENRSAYDELIALERASGSSGCSSVFLALDSPVRSVPESLRDSLFARAIAVAPEVPELWSGPATRLAVSHQWAAAERVLERGREAVRDPIHLTSFVQLQTAFRLWRGDTAAAISLERAFRAARTRDPRPGVRAQFEDQCSRERADGSGSAVDPRRLRERRRSPGDWAWLANALLQCGKEAIDRGEPLVALEFSAPLQAIADSVRLPDLYLMLYGQRGRALSKLGRAADAERELRRAIGFSAVAGRLHMVAEANHDLAHSFESQGRWLDASTAIDRYVALTLHMKETPHLTSLIDAGDIRWKAGWHASARAAFEDMVRFIDEQEVERYWAGAYYERIGDLQRARRYYAKAVTEIGTNSRAQSGLVRVYDALGLLDSAAAVARIHDAQESYWPPLEVPLLPAVLARQGRSGEALEIARAWAARREQRGNVQGAALAYLQHARLALDVSAGSEAQASSAHAERLATTMHLSSERVQAVTLRGRALRQLGLTDSAISTLRRATTLARADSTADNVLDAHLALGDALVARGESDAALAAYERAAQTQERVTRSFDEDLDRARYRDRHLLAFDGAIRALMGNGAGATRVGQLASWSARRKAAALTGATKDSRRVSLADLQSRLSARDALLDYLVVDSAVAAIVITREQASVVRLPISTDSLAAAVERLRHPLISVLDGRIDLARAPYSLATAAGLFAMLVRPLEARLAGKQRLLIVPDGPLHALSFEALVTALPVGRGDYVGARYLIDAYEVEYLPSSSFLAAPQSGPGKSLSGLPLLVVAYGAPGAEREAAALGAAWPASRTTMLTGMAATERAANAAMPAAGVVHFVVHAQASPRDPLASHLKLVRDSLDDGYLNLAEIAATRTRARLVVLSACETDAGPIYNGEGVMGLARAFLAGGAQSVIGTQWPVGPTMADVMGHFYQRLANGEAPSPALRQAKLALRSKRETAHPFYWAGAVPVVGGGR